MATLNPFDLLGEDDSDDINQLIAARKAKELAELKAKELAEQKAKELEAELNPAAAKKGLSQVPPAKNAGQAKRPSKHLPPSQAAREARSEAPRGGRRDIENSHTTNNGYSGGFRTTEDRDAGRTGERHGYGGNQGGYRGGRRGGFNNEDDNTDGERPRRAFERRSGTGRGNETKREGAGPGNWGSPSEDIVTAIEEPVNEGEKIVDAEKQSGDEAAENAKKDSPVTESDEKKDEPEIKEMTLEEYEKVLEEKRKALLVLKSEERKVDLDKEFESMQLLSNKKNDDDAFLKLGSDKDKRKEAGDKAKKSVSINEFLKPAGGNNSYRPGGRGRGERGSGGGYKGGGYGSNFNNVEAAAPAIEDVKQFPTLGSK